MKKYTLLLALIISLITFQSSAQSKKEFTIAFGSCNKQDLPQPLWDVILKDKPNLWIWLGDNIYGDSNDMSVIKAKYDLQLSNEGYKKLMAQVPVIGTWDDHDYGRNDAGKNYPHKKETMQLALDFLNEPANSPRRKQEGIYAAYNYKVGKKNIKVLLLDGRYNRDVLSKDSAKKAYIKNETGDMLGEEQWKWLEDQLKNSQADVHIIGSGIQVLAEDQPHEKWANFPAARKRLFDLLVQTQAKGVIIISGDRHIGEISKMNIPGLNYPLYDITSSGLTHSLTNKTSEINRYRVGNFVNQKNYGLLRFKNKCNKLKIEVDLKGEKGVYQTEKICF